MVDTHTVRANVPDDAPSSQLGPRAWPHCRCIWPVLSEYLQNAAPFYG